MDTEHQIQAPVDNVIVCHPEPLVAAATAAILRRSGTARSVNTAHTLTQLLGGSDHAGQVAVVFDAVDEDIADLFEALRYRNLDVPVVIVARKPTPARIAHAIELGAAGLVPEDCPVALLCRSILDAGCGRTSFAFGHGEAVTRALQARRLGRYYAQSRLAELSDLERKVLRGLACGATVTMIAAKLSVSPRTVRGYVYRLGTKLGERGQLRIAACGRQLLDAARAYDDFGRPAGRAGA